MRKLHELATTLKTVYDDNKSGIEPNEMLGRVSFIQECPYIRPGGLVLLDVVLTITYAYLSMLEGHQGKLQMDPPATYAGQHALVQVKLMEMIDALDQFKTLVISQIRPEQILNLMALPDDVFGRARGSLRAALTVVLDDYFKRFVRLSRLPRMPSQKFKPWLKSFL